MMTVMMSTSVFNALESFIREHPLISVLVVLSFFSFLLSGSSSRGGSASVSNDIQREEQVGDSKSESNKEQI